MSIKALCFVVLIFMYKFKIYRVINDSRHLLSYRI